MDSACTEADVCSQSSRTLRDTFAGVPYLVSVPSLDSEPVFPRAKGES